jgi:phospholipase A1/A2
MKRIVLLLLCTLILFAEENCDIKDIEDEKTKASMQKWLDGNFGLKPHNVNYILPYGYRENAYLSNIPKLQYSNIEAQLQVSLKLILAENLFGLNEKYYLAYTQQAFWQLYVDSAPFRESLYNPEAFVDFPIEDKDSLLRLRSLTFGYAHESNGQPNTEGITFSSSETLENLSRSINYLYLKLRMQHESLVSDLTFIAPISDLSDNPDIMDYRGHTELKFTYFLNEHMFTLGGRGNFSTWKGSMEATYSYPLIKDTNFYVKIFNGYGESLIDYNNNFTKYSVGFSFSR